MKECAVLFRACNDPEQWKKFQDFGSRMSPGVEGGSQAAVHFKGNGDLLFKF